MQKTRWQMRQAVSTTDLQRFWRKVLITDGCWEWLAHERGKGYGGFRFGGRHLYAHRFSYWLENELPDDLMIDHLCRNRICIRPSHLRLVTARVNALENSVSVGALNVLKTVCHKGHALAGYNLYITPAGFRHCRACKIARQRRWRRRHGGKR